MVYSVFYVKSYPKFWNGEKLFRNLVLIFFFLKFLDGKPVH